MTQTLDDWDSRGVRSCLGRLHVRVCGRGPASMVFWPSLIMDGAMWLELASRFTDRYRVVLVDSPGHGQSDPLDRMFTFDECARCVVEILDAISAPRTHFVGSAWGGMIGGTFAARYPERLAAAVLMNATARPARFRQRLDYAAMTRLLRLLDGIRGPLVGRAVHAFLGPTTRRERPGVETMVRSALERIDTDSAYFAIRSVVPARPDQQALFGSIRAPVLVIGGEEDRTFPPEESRRLAAAIPGAELQIIPGTAHLAGLERPDEVGQIIDDFFRRRAQTTS